MTIKTTLSESLVLPCGVTLSNRLSKAAMTEGLADAEGYPTESLINLYRIWGESGAGLLISGNIHIDSKHLERPGNVILENGANEKMHQGLANVANKATSQGAEFWAQISHAGRQTPIGVNKQPKAPSAVKVKLPGNQFGEPVALTLSEIKSLQSRFVSCAQAVIESGFTGVQIHAAHGYLLSQFLSPLSNQRSDEYGGSLENRARLLLDIVKDTRKALGPGIPIAVKLNSADFQRGGFNFDESLQVAAWLEEATIDLLEISGGTYEQPKLMGISMDKHEEQSVSESTASREAYFVDFAKAMRQKVKVPLMVTGGFRRRDVMERAIEEGSVDVIGLGRPMVCDTDAPKQLLNGAAELRRYEDEITLLPKWFGPINRLAGIKKYATLIAQYWFYAQLYEIGDNSQPNRTLSPIAGMRRVLKRQNGLISSSVSVSK